MSDPFSIAVRLHRSGRHSEAVEICGRIVATNPNDADAWHIGGVAALHAGQPQEAVRRISRAIELKPDWPEAYSNLGLALRYSGRVIDGIACFRRALEVRPDWPVALSNLGNALRSVGELNEAVECYERALQIKPNYVEAYVNLGSALFDLGRLEDAIVRNHQAIAFEPNLPQAPHNMGSIFLARGALQEAADWYGRASAIKPDFADARKSLAQVWLLGGDFDRGWPEFEWRWKTSELPVREFNAPRWNREAVEGKTVLVWAEQGLGDTIQFARYAAMVKERGAKVVFVCQKPLVNLLTRYRGMDELVGEGDAPPAFDFHVPLLSLPGIFGTTLETIPAEVPYLYADAALVEQWQAKLEPIPGFRIGINWHGRAGKRESRQRDVPPEFFEQLASVPGVRLVSLQKGEGRNELAVRGEPLGIFDPGDDMDTEHGAFMDTAAIMMNLDLVITSDTSVAHLAGALGVPAWVALPFVPDWRWMLDRSDSPWYPTMRLFRQKKAGDWAGVFEEIEAALRDLIGDR